MTNKFDEILRKQGWNLHPKSKFQIPSSLNPLVNAARAIAVSAYPRPEHLMSGGKAERYSLSLLAYILRISKLTGGIDQLPVWAASHKASSMQHSLNSGVRNLYRAFMLRDLIHSAQVMKSQYKKSTRGEKSTFTVHYRPDLSGLTIELPVTPTVEGYILSGSVPDTKLSSIRAAILYHLPALAEFEGPATKKEGRDSEIDYQNAYTRHVKPALYVQHIVQVVWEAATKYAEESKERNIPIDQILMRKVDWAKDIHITTAERAGIAIFEMRELGINSCWCEMTHFAEPSSDS